MLLLLGIAIAGFVAQLVDGALGMGFGNISTSLLLTLGLTPALASATSHVAEIATSGASGLSHWRLGNLDTKMLILLAAPGAVGAFLGAVVLSNLSVEAAGPWVSGVLLLLGVTIIVRHVRDRHAQTSNQHHLPFAARHRWFLPPLGFVGGFLDASGGGGWGPVTTSTLMAAGSATPRKIIGSVSTAEFFVSVAAVVGFLISIGPEDVQWDIVIGAHGRRCHCRSTRGNDCAARSRTGPGYRGRRPGDCPQRRCLPASDWYRSAGRLHRESHGHRRHLRRGGLADHPWPQEPTTRCRGADRSRLIGAALAS